MTNPAYYLPLVSTHPVGWAILGAAGYIAYKSGKKAGANAEEQIEKEPVHDRVVKGAMKSAYKAKMKVNQSLRSTKDKYSTMWQEAQEEATE
ncbi:MAG: hypothetical protein CSA33_01910 [Desulfobulbus propionicus]|nr:MAG: hypothetical protein CSA33_01910 [Desulfobulbus propionicus]